MMKEDYNWSKKMKKLFNNWLQKRKTLAIKKKCDHDGKLIPYEWVTCTKCGTRRQYIPAASSMLDSYESYVENDYNS